MFQEHTNYIINEKRQVNVDHEAKGIVTTGVKLIREEIRNLKLSWDSYLNKDDTTDSINEKGCWKGNLLNTLCLK